MSTKGAQCEGAGMGSQHFHLGFAQGLGLGVAGLEVAIEAHHVSASTLPLTKTERDGSSPSRLLYCWYQSTSPVPIQPSGEASGCCGLGLGGGGGGVRTVAAGAGSGSGTATTGSSGTGAGA